MIALLIISAFTAIALMFLIIGIVKSYKHKYNSEDWIGGSIIALVVIGFLGWTLIGSLLTTKRTYEVISKENMEILAGAERIIVTETKLNITEVFKNAKTYNDITIKGDSTFKIGRKFNMYNYEIGTYITR